MARIAGVTLPNNKRIIIALTYVFGIGDTTSASILKQVGLDASLRVKDMTEEQVTLIREALEKSHRLEGDLRRDIMSNIKRLKDTGSYRGTRHMRKLPVRGQRTKTNSRTVRGNVRKTMGSGRRALTKT